MEHKLWQQLAEWNESCEWVELSRELSLAPDSYTHLTLPTILRV